MLQHWGCSKFVSIDPWIYQDDYLDPSNAPTVIQQGRKTTTVQRLAQFGDRSRIITGTSLEVAPNFEDGVFSFIYLDARHDYDSIKADLAAWYPKLCSGGLFAGHDYFDHDPERGLMSKYVPRLFGATYYNGVQSAVDEFGAEHGLTIGSTLADEIPSWWTIKE